VDDRNFPIVSPCTSQYEGNGEIASTLWGGPVPGGTYVLKFEGTGSVRLSGPAVNGGTQTFTSAGSYDVILNEILPPQNGGIVIDFPVSDISDPIRHVALVPKAYENDYLSDPFYPPAIAELSRFGVLRTGSLTLTNNNYPPLRNWGDAHLITDEQYSGSDNKSAGAFPYELMDDLANKAGADIWISIPHEATDSFIQTFASQVNLDPGRKLWIEYSNEPWNTNFLQRPYLEQMGSSTFPGSTGDTAVQRWVVYRSAQIWNIFENANVPIVKVLPGSMAGNWSQGIVSRLYESNVNPTGQQPTVLGVAPYLNLSEPSILQNNCVSSVTASGLLDLLDQYVEGSGAYTLDGCPQYSDTRPRISQIIPSQLNLAVTNGMQLVAYEGGQSLTHQASVIWPLLTAANRDPKMRDVMNHLMDYWFSVNPNGMFVFYSYIGKFSRGQYWGAKEYQTQTNSPKWLAIQDQINKGN
jgi:hypothetical protein